MPVEQVVKSVCNYKQAYTQYGGLRPFGVAFLFGGWDKHFGFQLYQSDPGGNYSGWKATVIGQNNQAGKSLLKTEFVEDNSVEANLKLSIRILLKTLDASSPTPDRIELSVMRKDDRTDRIVHTILSDAEVSTSFFSPHLHRFKLYLMLFKGNLRRNEEKPKQHLVIYN
jgi:20S proteasome subunit alpha 3